MASFKDTLQASKQTKASAKKTTVPVLENVPANITQASSDFIAKMKQKKQLEADLAALNSEIAEYTQGVQDDRAFKGDFNNSYKIPVGEEFLMVTTKNVFKINPEDEDKIRKMFGDKFPEFIKEKLEVVLKEEVFQNEALQNELMELLGDSFSKFFNTFTSLKVQDDYDEKVYSFAKTAKKLADIRVLVEPSKAALK